MILHETKHVPASEFSQTFAQGMLDRMGMSYFKYGAVAEAYPSKVNAIKSLLIRLLRYLGKENFVKLVHEALAAVDTIENAPHRRGNGNTEYLMDAANFAMIEYMHPSLPNAHYSATDSDQSPGRAWNSGGISATANTTNRENIRRGGSKYTTSGGFYKSEGD